MRRDTLLRLLVDMADIVDRPGAPGGGAILLEAVAEIEAMQRAAAVAESLADHATTDGGVTRCPNCWTMWAANPASADARPDPVEWR